jgi:hypothetical protein
MMLIETAFGAPPTTCVHPFDEGRFYHLLTSIDRIVAAEARRYASIDLDQILQEVRIIIYEFYRTNPDSQTATLSYRGCINKIFILANTLIFATLIE